MSIRTLMKFVSRVTFYPIHEDGLIRRILFVVIYAVSFRLISSMVKWLYSRNACLSFFDRDGVDIAAFEQYRAVLMPSSGISMYVWAPYDSTCLHNLC